MKTTTLNYFIIVLIVIIVGIISRQISIIPLGVGDVLYSVMIYFGIRMLQPKFTQITSAVIALAFCFMIECFQLYQSDWIVEIRKTFLGHYILGQGFLWSDLVAYTIGVVLAFFLDKKISDQNHLSS